MLFCALLLPVVVPASLVAAASEKICLLQAEVNVDQEGGRLVPEKDHEPTGFRGGKTVDVAPRAAYAWDAINTLQRQAPLVESVKPDLVNMFVKPPEHRSKKLITLLIVLVLAAFVVHSGVLWRVHKVAQLELRGRVTFGPTVSDISMSMAQKILKSLRKSALIWPMIISEAIAFGIVGPSDAYLNLDHFSKKHGGPSNGGFTCAVMPQMPGCQKAVEDNVHLTMILGAVNPVFCLILGPMFGALSDSFGRRPILILIQSFFFLTPLFRSLYVFYGLNLEIAFWLTPLAEIPITGLMAAFFSDYVEDTRILAALFGIMAAIMTGGNLIGLLIGKAMTIKTAFTVFIIMKAVGMVYIFFFLPESLPRNRKAPFSWKSMIPGMNIDVLVNTPIRRTLTGIVLMATFCDSGWMRIVPSYQLKYFNWTKDANYTSFIVMLVSNCVCSGILLPYITNVVGETAVLSIARWSGEFLGVGLILATMNWHVFTYMGLFMGPLTMAFPVLQALQSRSISLQEQGRALSSINTLRSVMEAIGPPIFGAIFDANSNRSSQLQMAWRISVTGTGVNVVCLVLLLFLPKQIQDLESEEAVARRKAKVEKLPVTEVQQPGRLQGDTPEKEKKRLVWFSEQVDKTPMAPPTPWQKHNTRDIWQKRIAWASEGSEANSAITEEDEEEEQSGAEPPSRPPNSRRLTC